MQLCCSFVACGFCSCACGAPSALPSPPNLFPNPPGCTFSTSTVHCTVLLAALCVVVLIRCLPGHRHARRPRIAEAEPALRTAVRGLVHSFRRKPKRDLIANVLYVYDMLRYTARNSSTNKCARACIIKSTERAWASTKQSSRLYSSNRHSPPASRGRWGSPPGGSLRGMTSQWALQ